MRPDPKDPKKVLVQDTQTGKDISKPKPPDFDQQSGKVHLKILETIGEFLIPWVLTPSELGCSTLDCHPSEYPPYENPYPPPGEYPIQECSH